jgi:16S rRNA (cytosine1402-N4)-methyltransferase
MTTRAGSHVPVMLEEVLAVLRPRDGAIYVDGTFGGGGYTRALLERARCTVYGIDRDQEALARGEGLRERFAGRLTLICGRFSDMDALLAARGITKADGVALDLGVSSFQLDSGERGFSFSHDGPLDMRMDTARGPTAADLLNTLPEEEIANILREYGEEKNARRLARAIVAARPLTRTQQLAALIERCAGRGRQGQRIHPATRTFQALRIAVNEELLELERGLLAAERILTAGGRLAVVSFHSLEDRIVKRFLSARSGKAAKGSRHMPAADSGAAPIFREIGRQPQQPSAAEIAANPRARSAKLRAGERLDAPAPSAPIKGELA